MGRWHDNNYDVVIFNPDKSGSVKISGYQTEDFSWQIQSTRDILITYDPTTSEVWTVLSLDDNNFSFMQGSNGPINCTH